MAAVREQFEIKRAERKQARLRLAVCAASNGGKTWSSLELGFGIVEELLARGVLTGAVEGKVGMIDTERKSGQLYAHLGPFDTIELGPPYSTARYIGALEALERAGCAVIIIDSISHAWAGAGGVLALLDTFEAKERFSAFGTTVNPAQDEFVDAMLRSSAHVIATMRSKTAWVLEDRQTRSGHTVKAPRRIGMAPIQRPGIEYEFTSLLDLDTGSHFATVLKNRCPVFDGWKPQKLTREHGRALTAWLLEGAADVAPAVTVSPIDRAQAVCDAACRACGRVENLPDLARVFDAGQRDLRAFRGAVDAAELTALLDRLIDAKDAQKVRWGVSGAPVRAVEEPAAPEKPASALCGPMEAAISADQEARLRDAARTARVSLGDLMLAFGVARLEQIRATAFDTCMAWVMRGREEPMTAERALAEMEDDIPWPQ